MLDFHLWPDVNLYVPGPAVLMKASGLYRNHQGSLDLYGVPGATNSAMSGRSEGNSAALGVCWLILKKRCKCSCQAILGRYQTPQPGLCKNGRTLARRNSGHYRSAMNPSTRLLIELNVFPSQRFNRRARDVLACSIEGRKQQSRGFC